ncbi:MAG: hypothetical protein U1E53_17695 [Dongiaceae bacterium]
MIVSLSAELTVLGSANFISFSMVESAASASGVVRVGALFLASQLPP